MPLVISDQQLEQAGFTEQDARIELACRAFEAGRLQLRTAAQLAAMSRAEFEAQCRDRHIAVYRITEEHYRQDLETLAKLGH